ncbi:transporter [Salix suchowensis]|nr:transporter [Salix suchowensis]
MDGSRVSSQPGCKGRKVGEEWESNGVRYKPADSQHPDRDANLEIWVGEWLTDEEYKVAKLRQLTDSLSTSTTSSTSLRHRNLRKLDLLDGLVARLCSCPPITGKKLLWEAPMTPSQRRYSSQYRDFNNNSLLKDPFRQSVATNIGLRVNPFQQQAPVSSSRRLSSPNPRSLLTSTALQSSIPGSPFRRLLRRVAWLTARIFWQRRWIEHEYVGSSWKPTKRISKWEKQDREAEAMRKVREAKRAKEKEREDKEKREKAASAPVAAPLTLPTSAPAPTERRLLHSPHSLSVNLPRKRIKQSPLQLLRPPRLLPTSLPRHLVLAPRL